MKRKRLKVSSLVPVQVSKIVIAKAENFEKVLDIIPENPVKLLKSEFGSFKKSEIEKAGFDTVNFVCFLSYKVIPE